MHYLRIEELLKKQARKRIEKNKHQDHHHNKKSSKKDNIEMKSLPEPTLPQVDMNNLTTGNNYLYPNAPRQYPHQNQRSPMQNRPPYYHQPPSSNGGSTGTASQFGRRNSLSSVNSDQIGLTSHAQEQAWSSPYYNHSNNNSNSNLSYNMQYQQYQQPYQQYNNNYNQPYQQHGGYY